MATDKQVKAICHQLVKANVQAKPNAMRAIEDLDIGTASDVISAFYAGSPAIAIAQLRHLHPESF